MAALDTSMPAAEGAVAARVRDAVGDDFELLLWAVDVQVTASPEPVVVASSAPPSRRVEPPTP